MDYKTETLGNGISVCINKIHRFGTDAFLLCDFAQHRQIDTICDFGTGCGIIPLLMARNMPPRKAYAVDIQPDAIALLKQSIALSHLNFIEPVCADLNTWDTLPADSLNLITCNPPYKAAGAGIESLSEQERIARHEILCDIDGICRAASRLLKHGGRLCICNRPERLADSVKAMQSHGIEPKRLRMVSKTPSDAPWLFLLEGKKGGRSFMKILPQFYVWDGNDFSKELKAVYAGRNNS